MNLEIRHQPSAPSIHMIHVKPALPPRLDRLRDLAFNLRWSWHQETADLFRRLDQDLWEEVGHNPVRLLGMIAQARLERAAGDAAFLAHMDRAHESLQTYLSKGGWFNQENPELQDLRVAYFSAEFGLSECLPIYSGGLGVLAGDHLKSASELGVPLIGVGLAYQEGYFHQYLNADGWQQETYRENDFYNMPLTLVVDGQDAPVLVSVPFPGREVRAQIWKAAVGRVSLFLLDTNVTGNSHEDRGITRRLYGGSKETRIQQEIVLGIGGLRALDALKLRPDVCHINEGHAAFLGVERARQLMAEQHLDYDAARQITSASCIFTTHTPVPAGFDLFEPALMEKYFADYVGGLGMNLTSFIRLGQVDPEDPSQPFNMALFAVRHSTHRNGVSRLHGEVTRRMMQPWWPGYPAEEVPVESVTNGVHLRSWISSEVQALLNRYLGPYWSDDPTDTAVWRQVDQIPDEELWRTHLTGKQRLVSFTRRRLVQQVKSRGGSPEELEAARHVLDPEKLIIGFARRFATYKRSTMVLRDLDRLRRIITRTGAPVQFIFAGKAHPADAHGKELIKKIVHFAQDPAIRASVVFLEDYDINVGRHMVQGVDVWMNTPRRPLEASGTSGMKAAANGVLNLSIPDGWWVEGYEPEVGWSIGHGELYENDEYQDGVEANALYDLLEREVVPLYYQRAADGLPSGWIKMMRSSMRSLSPRFNTNRMVSEYATRFYVRSARRASHFLNGGMERVRNLVDWSRRVAEHWHEVRVDRVQQENGHELHVGASIPIRVCVRLGQLRPEDVSVELYHGATDSERRVTGGSITHLECTSSEDGHHWYEGMLNCPTSGLYGYSVRVRPSHPDAVVPNELSLITWY